MSKTFAMAILTPTDFSEAARQAADVAAALAAKRGSHLRLVHSLSPWIASSEAPVAATLDGLAHQQLEAEAVRLHATGAELDISVRRGSTGEEVASVAGEVTADMIVLGSGDPAAGHRLAGSVAEQIAEGVPVPALVVRRAAPLLAWLAGHAPLRVLCAVDFSLSSDAALRTLKSMAEIGPLEIDAVHFARPGELRGDAEARPAGEADASLQRDVWQRLHAHLGERKVAVHVVPDDGHAPEGLARLAASLGADLVVVGTRQIHGLKRLVDPSFSRGVLTHTSSNVLCVPVAVGPPEPETVPLLRRVLVAVGFAAEDARVLRHARALATPGAFVHLVHICPPPSPTIDPLYVSDMYNDEGGHAETFRKAADQRLASVRPRESDLPGVSITQETVIHTNPATALCEAAERFAADVICLGSRGHSRIGVALLGSTAQGVIARAHRPVYVIPPPRL